MVSEAALENPAVFAGRAVSRVNQIKTAREYMEHVPFWVVCCIYLFSRLPHTVSKFVWEEIIFEIEIFFKIFSPHTKCMVGAA